MLDIRLQGFDCFEFLKMLTFFLRCVIGDVGPYLVRQAAQRASKRVKMSSSEESDSESEKDGSTSGSEFKLTGTDSAESDSPSEDSNASSDFNPFDTDSDSDAGNVTLLF
jgi:hypothetical protein